MLAASLDFESDRPIAPRSQTPCRGTDPGTIIVAEHSLNPHECFRAEIATVNGRDVVRLSRWKKTATGFRSTGQVFEFGSHRTAAIAKLIADVQRVLEQGGAR